MLHVILFEPEIPPNTGNIIRLCANSGCHLHLIEPLGFSLDDRNLKRAGLDYHAMTNVEIHPDINHCTANLPDATVFTFSTHHKKAYSDCDYPQHSALIFGPESRGLTLEVRDLAKPQCQVTLPMVTDSRSLNLSNCVAVAVYEAWKQHNFSPWQ
ncbi:MAG: tRNA (cytidine/uridine-2'-O-)-methyltransferase [Parasphingorhabdus sp.]|jgi:tRNA (cytidine/uridine-2'-O-)-methyltransferase